MSASLLALALAQSVQPVSTATATAEPPPPAETVITVRGRRERVFETPASVSLVDPAGLASADDLPLRVAGVWMINDQDPGTNILSIRAATTDRLQQASVAFVLDGVPLADTELFTARLFDLTRVEVLKGPQGALYGKNAAGGVIGIETASGTGGHVAARIGDGGLREGEVAGGTLAGSWTLRAAGLWSAADGWIRNTTLNRIVDATETRLLRLSAGGPLAGWDVQAKAHVLDEDGGAAWASSANVTGLAGGLLDGMVLTDPIGDYEGRAWRRWIHAAGAARRPLGQGVLGLRLARDEYSKRWDEELDYRPGPLTFFGFPAFPAGIQPIRQPIDIAATTAEARWSLEGEGAWSGQAGVFAQDVAKDRVDDFGPLLFGGPALAYRTRSRQVAVFGGVTWRPTPRVQFEAQVRHDIDNRAQTIEQAANGARVERREADFARTQPRVAVRWTLRDTLAVHASYGEAFRPGGFNPAPGPGSIWQPRYRPEITAALEAGIRLRGLPMAGSLDLTVFRSDVADYQNYTFLDGQSVTLNVDAVRVDGLEASLTLRPLSWLEAGVEYALADARIGRFIATDPLLGSPATRDYSGKRVPNAPRDTARLWAKASAGLGGGVTASLRLDAHHAGVTAYELDNVLRSPPRWWGDLEAGLRHGDLAVVLRAENLTDERWAVSAFGQGMLGLLAGLGPGGPFDTFTVNRGRRVSVQVRRDF